MVKRLILMQFLVEMNYCKKHVFVKKIVLMKICKNIYFLMAFYLLGKLLMIFKLKNKMKKKG